MPIVYLYQSLLFVNLQQILAIYPYKTILFIPKFVYSTALTIRQPEQPPLATVQGFVTELAPAVERRANAIEFFSELKQFIR